MPKRSREDREWGEMMALAENHGLISYAYGGVAVLMHKDEQRKSGNFCRIQRMTGNCKRSKSLADCEGDEKAACDV